eukprot:633342-Rhodomonas_salina.1
MDVPVPTRGSVRCNCLHHEGPIIRSLTAETNMSTANAEICRRGPLQDYGFVIASVVRSTATPQQLLRWTRM